MADRIRWAGGHLVVHRNRSLGRTLLEIKKLGGRTNVAFVCRSVPYYAHVYDLGVLTCMLFPVKHHRFDPSRLLTSMIGYNVQLAKA